MPTVAFDVVVFEAAAFGHHALLGPFLGHSDDDDLEEPEDDPYFDVLRDSAALLQKFTAFDLPEPFFMNRVLSYSLARHSEAASKFETILGAAIVGDMRVEPSFFELMRIPLIAGRTFAPSDDADEVIIISRRLAIDMYETLDVLGKGFPKFESSMTIIGVSEDAPLINAGATMVAEQYRPIGRDHYEEALLLARSRGNPATLLGPMREAARAANTRVLPSTWLLKTRYEERVRTSSLASTIAGTTCMLALTLACFGIFGVVSYGIAMRTREIGIRRALGASARSIIALVLKHLVIPVGVGMVLGSAAGLGAGWLLARAPFYLPASDVLTPVLIVMFFALTAGLAAVVPASRALGAEPLRSLRHE